MDTSLLREGGSRKADGSVAGTPHKSKRINLGTPANYYFKHMNSGKRNMDISFADEGNTGTLSIPGFKMDGTPSKAETSFFSMAGSSTASEGSDDLLNKSTLSDTTELTASNFVLVTTSKQNMIRKNRDSLSRPENKENVLNRKEREVQNKPQSIDRGEGDVDQKTSNISGSKNNDTEEVYVARQKSSVRGASPSLRSRISSSPASLRRFHEDLKSSRIQRQIQREEDTKKRLSIEGTDTLDSMNAQLEALTGDGVFGRKRLPPTFNQESESQKIGSNRKSNHPSPAGSSSDETATIEMGDLDDLLGMKNSSSVESPSDATADKSLVGKDKSTEKSTSVSQITSPEYASPTTTPILNPRKRLTPSKLSSSARRVMNPDSLFSPARNTRSATKKRKLAEENRDESLTEQVDRSKQSSNVSTRLFQVELQPTNDTSVDSDSSEMLIDSPGDRKSGEKISSNGDDTASLGDIANLFGISKAVDESFESSVAGSSEKKTRVSEAQETASIGDLNAILNPGFTSNHSPTVERTNEESPEVLQPLTSPNAKISESVADTKSVHSSRTESNESNITSSNESEKNLMATEDLASASKENSLSLFNSPPRKPSPALRRTSSVHGSNSKVIPKSPIRLTPNRHQKPTPTKLTPIPRRVMNPQNPNSPARNTRSSKKNDDSKIEGTGLDESQERGASDFDQHSKVEVEKVLFSSNRRQSEGPSTQKPPVGILSSKKNSFPRRSVAFGSPEAAEYNIGSPSVSMTPMPKGRAKALFAVPGDPSFPNETATEQEQSLVNANASIGHGMNILVDKITANEMNHSPELSPIMKNEEGRDASFSGSPSEMKDSSVELTDSESIASINSKSNKYTSDFVVPLHAQKLDFSAASDISEIDDSRADVETDKKVENTVELEGNMLDLLEVANGGKEKENDSSDAMDISGDSSALALKDTTAEAEQFTGNLSKIGTKPGVEGEKTVELEGNMLSLLEATNGGPIGDENNVDGELQSRGESEQFTTDISYISKTSIQGDNTVELEGNMLSLLQATDSGTGKQKDGTNEMDITERSEQFTADISSVLPKRSNTGEKTVELEGNMVSLLQATGTGDKSKETENTTNSMDINGNSTSMMLNQSETVSEQFTGSLNKMIEKSDKTVELEGNMFSLLEATYGGKNGEGNDSNDKVNMMEDSLATAEKANSTKSEQFTGNLEITEVEVVHSRRRSNGGRSSTSVIESEDKAFKSDELSMLRGSDDNSVYSSAFRSISNDDSFLRSAGGARKRRKSLSSNSFIVDRTDEIQSLVEDITSENKSLTYDKSVSFSDTAEFITAARSDSGPNQLDVPAFTSMLLEGLEFAEKDQDILSNSFARFSKAESSVDRIVFERWGQFIEAVCGEVERRIDLEGAAVSSLAEIVDDDPKFYTMLHQRLQSNEHSGKIKESMSSLVQAGQKLIEYDWNTWLATVLESFHGPLADTQQIYANDASKIEETLRHIKKIQTDISLMNDMETKLAKEKSLRRQREAATELEKEIELLESQVSTTNSSLLHLEEEECNIVMATRDHKELIGNAKVYDGLRVEAESSQKNFVSLNGLHSWSMKTTSENDLEFINTGSCQQTHLKLMYGGAESGKADRILSSRVDSSLANSKTLHVYHEPLSGFLDTATKRLMETAQQSSGHGPVHISEHLQKYTWLAGRLDLIAKEFQVVQRRYNGFLHRKNGDLFSFVVEFESERSTVVANFRIESAYYPSFPIEVRLDLMSGDQDLETIKKALVKNANPGFGSLSRACDIIQSIVQGKK